MFFFIVAKTVIITGGVTALKKHQRQWFKESLISGIRFWFRKFIHGHFRDTATQKYDYPIRTIAYRQSRDKRDRPPLVKTGATKRAITTFITTTGTAKSATGTMNAPWYIREIGMRNGPAMALEITKITPAEKTKIDAFIGRAFAKLINDNNEKKIVRL